jgi:outer membrane protein OmpA-like peptidoglycan-associated protein
VVGIIENKGCPAKEENKEPVATKATVDLQDLLFETSKADLTKENTTILDNVVKVMKESPAAKLMINGFTDNTGAEALNVSLSQRRATMVKNYLVSKGISAKRLTARGNGSATPVGDNSTPDGRAKNRRVSFILSK